ncbi:hypothetical protein CKF54_05360 [Psittacicella hinzii]|uniref:Uncharacterized protein n=1 Tax=Psittacicella hinzii TaxID=2028575 RepID=A0A3A1Y4J1_9GAMM|nr:hypothetical protein [Psittacicella hinzii]RIY32138.1 hypothetical protein CKF54_05360 [Psittacicella hinzii]
MLVIGLIIIYLVFFIYILLCFKARKKHTYLRNKALRALKREQVDSSQLTKLKTTSNKPKESTSKPKGKRQKVYKSALLAEIAWREKKLQEEQAKENKLQESETTADKPQEDRVSVNNLQEVEVTVDNLQEVEAPVDNLQEVEAPVDNQQTVSKSTNKPQDGL